MTTSTLSGDGLGAMFMTLGSLAYVVNDGLVRIAADDGLDIYQALFLRGCAMIVVLATLLQWRRRRRGEGHGGRVPLSPPLLLRIAAEVVGTALFFAAIVELEFANAQTILMLVPFVVTAVAARQGEHVTSRRYVLVGVGFLGVLAVIRPTPDDFSWWSLVVVVAALALVVREFATQRISTTIEPLPIALLTALAITAMMGLISVRTGWEPVTIKALAALVVACLLLTAGYLFTIETVRVGALSVSAPFRYTSVLGAVVVGISFFGERPDTLTLIGCSLIIVAGVATAVDERGTGRSDLQGP